MRMITRFAESTLVPVALHHVVDGVDALALLRRADGYTDVPRPDLILLDLNMARMDGRQALVEIKADPELTAIPPHRPPDT